MSFSRSRPNYSRGRGRMTMSLNDEFRPAAVASAAADIAAVAGSSMDRRSTGDFGVPPKSEGADIGVSANTASKAFPPTANSACARSTNAGRGGYWSTGKKYGRSARCTGYGNARGYRGKGRRNNEDVDMHRKASSSSTAFAAAAAASSARELQDQSDELMALASIYDQPDVFILAEGGFGGRFCAFVELPQPFFVLLNKCPSTSSGSTAEAAAESSSEGVSRRNQHSVRFLPPITLLFNLPHDYPSTRRPRFRLICGWLSSEQLSSLCRRLDDIWCEDSGEVVLFKWTVFLKEDALNHLGLSDTLDLSWASNATGDCDASVDDKAESTRSAVDKRATLMSEILEFDERRREEVFRSEFFKCNVCFEERVGAKCMRFTGCEHTYCRECMKSYFEVQIGDGHVNRLSCPSEKCASQALPSQVRDLVGPELYAKYDRLLLATTLDSMSDITYCPRDSCQCAVLLESGSALASCPSCCYAFCTFCLMAYHGIEPCKLKFDERLSLYNKYTNGNAEERTRLETRYGRNQLKRLVEATMSDMWLKDNSKCCPRCNAQIEKIDGCNKMTCSKCNSYFCWLCMQRLDPVNPYRHYDNRSGNGSCFGRLFQGVIHNDGDLDDEFMLQEFQAAEDEFEELFLDVSTDEFSDNE